MWLSFSVQNPILVVLGCSSWRSTTFLERGLLALKFCHRVVLQHYSYQQILLFFPICSEGWGLLGKLLPVLICLRSLGVEGGTTAAITSLLHAVRKDMKQQVFKLVLISSVVSERLWEPPWMSRATLCWRVRKGFTYRDLFFFWEACSCVCSPETLAIYQWYDSLVSTAGLFSLCSSCA